MGKDIKKHIIIVILLSITLILFWTESRAGDEDSDLNYNGSDCIWIRSIRDYTPLDSKNLLVWGTGNRPYLVRLTSHAYGMRSAFGISVQSRDDQFCPYGGDGLIFDTTNPIPTTVRSISKLTKEQADQILVRYGKKEGSEPITPAPQEPKGAEVEELD